MSGRVMGFLGCLALPALLSAAGPGKVEQLAKEGHWLESGWAAHAALLGKPAPAMALSGWLNGEVKPSDMKGRIVVVDFWATWCGPCRRSIPHNNELAKKFAAQGVLVVGACGGGGEDQMGAVAQATGLAYPTARVDAATTKAWAVQWWPTYAVVDRQGRLRALGLQPEYVERVVQALLAEDAPAAKG